MLRAEVQARDAFDEAQDLPLTAEGAIEPAEAREGHAHAHRWQFGRLGGRGGATGNAGSTGTGGSGVTINCSGTNYNGRYVSVTFKDAIIGPGKVDHTAWDVGSGGGTLTIPNSVLNDLGTALASGNPVGGAIAVVGGPALNSAIDATAKRDVFGWVSGTAFGVMGDAFYLAQSSERIDNNYTPAELLAEAFQ